jgi:tetratricopeptide (TPR) repeat protein
LPSPERPAARRRFGIGLPGLVLALVVLACFFRAVGHDFICLDDHGYVVENEHVLGGLTWANLGWALRTTEMGNWHPVTWCSHLLDAQLFGSRPWGHHLTNVLLHVVNTLLVLIVLGRMTGAFWRSLMVAALFGLHPLRVESVAWISERKDVLSAAFGLLTLWAYSAWVCRTAEHRPGAWRIYGMALAFFALGLLSKPMLVTVPCVLLLLDYWPFRRFGAVGPGARRLILEKVPFFALAAAASVIALLAQASHGALGTSEHYPWVLRLGNAVTAYTRYLGKAVFPVGLSVGYPFAPGFSAAGIVLAAALLAGISVVVFLKRNRQPYLLVGWLWFLGMLVPVIGLVQVGVQSMADRYSYLPLIGVSIMAVWSIADGTAGWSRRVPLLGALAGIVVAGLTGLTWRQLGSWRDSETLFGHAVAIDGRNLTAHSCLGYVFARTPGRTAEALSEYRTAVRLAPNQADLHFALGNVLLETPGRRAEAIAEFRTAVRLDPEAADAHLNLGIALAASPESLDAAIVEYQTVIRLQPERAEAHVNLARALLRPPERIPDAVAEFRAALRAKPDDAEYHNQLGAALAPMPGRLPEAIAELETAIRLAPGSAMAHFNLAEALAQFPERQTDAVAEYRIALRLRPAWAGAHCNLGLVLATMPGRLAEAVVEYEAALRASPDFAEAHNNLGNALAQTPGRSADAISEYRAALAIKPDYWEAEFNLGALLANFPDRATEAVGHLEAAIRLNPDLEPARALIARLRPVR